LTNDISCNDIQTTDIDCFNRQSQLDGEIKMSKNINKYLPLTESTAYILLALKQPLHGYGVMQKVEIISENTVKIGPGTLYGAFSTLESEGLISKAGEEDRRKLFVLTSKGREIIKEHIRRLEIMIKNGLIIGDY